ncbi:MAG TPA: alpha/beta hydrolase [Solirubrobacteraceae bacterium]|nr:alpha/beta hydrolase [Solirubrobacteraceae bacterium]
MSRTRDEATAFEFEVEGRTVTGRIAEPRWVRPGAPLLVAVHGAGFTAEFFDTSECSLLRDGTRLGVTTLALNRPGYAGSTPLAAGRTDFGDLAVALAADVSAAYDLLERPTGGVVLTGQSSGCAIATMLAAREDPGFPLSGLSIVGLGVEIGTWTRGFERQLPEDGMLDRLTAEPIRERLFGPPETYEEDALQALAATTTSAHVSELRQVNRYPEIVAQYGERIRVPVQCIMPELDRIWTCTPSSLRRLTTNFVNSARVDSTILPATGHACDHHRSSTALHLRQLAFALECALPRSG